MTEFEFAPSGVITDTVAAPATVSKLDGTVTVSCVDVAALGVSVVPKSACGGVNVTVSPAPKFVPVTTRVIAALPAVAKGGAKDAADGLFPLR